MSTQDDYLNKLLLRGLVDHRKMAVVASAKKLPGGEYGLCLLCLNQNILNIYDTDFSQNVGELFYSIDLKNVSDFKSSSFVFNRYMIFVYNGFTYKLCDFGNAKNFLEAVKSEL